MHSEFDEKTFRKWRFFFIFTILNIFTVLIKLFQIFGDRFDETKDETAILYQSMVISNWKMITYCEFEIETEEFVQAIKSKFFQSFIFQLGSNALKSTILYDKINECYRLYISQLIFKKMFFLLVFVTCKESKIN